MSMEFIYPAELPVSGARERIMQAVRSSQVVIISGQTGSGKTTQIPKMLLELGRGTHGRQIMLTQPRRLAARTVAERIADEMHTALGREIGYRIRFTDRSSPSTRLCVATDGILLAHIQRDPLLSAYDTIMIDEAHERSLNIDFLLGYLSQLLHKRKDLKLIITSATIDSQKFQKHFSDVTGYDVPVIEVSGRTYPVRIVYEPLGGAPALMDTVPGAGNTDSSTGSGNAEKTHDDSADTAHAVARACLELAALSSRERGARDILVFASGERDIHDYEDAVSHAFGQRKTDLRNADAIEIIPLYARLSAKEQHRVFEPHEHQRIIIATNVAETSLTVPGIRFVVDPGFARISRYSKTAKVQRLPVEAISQASADQRAGRCGRIADGIAVRLYSREDYESRPQFTDPEIQRTSLGAVILQMLSAGVARTADDITDFGFIDPPDMRSVTDGFNELTELGAVKRKHGDIVLTGIGRRLARIPIDVRLGRMMVQASRMSADTLAAVLVVTAFLSLQDPRERPDDKAEEADRIHNRYADSSSDFITALNIWDRFFQADGKLSNSALRKACKAEFMNYLRMRQWADLYGQLCSVCAEMRWKVGGPFPISRPDIAIRQLPQAQQSAHSLCCSWDSDSIHTAMLSGLLSSMGMQTVREPKASDFAGLNKAQKARALKRAQKTLKNSYRGSRGIHFSLFPASAVFKTTPEWVMAGELVETSRLWARSAAAIKPEWAESLGRHLTRTTYAEPHWSGARGAAIAKSTVLLYGLPIVQDRPVQWARINPQQAREFLIRQGLVDGDIRQRFPYDSFVERNRQAIDQADEETHRTRRIADSVNDDDLFLFYDSKLPQGITSVAALGSWWKKEHAEQPSLLDFTADSVERLSGTDTGFSIDAYPDYWHAAGTDGSTIPLRLSYIYDTRSERDGVTVHIPLSVLSRIRPQEFTWNVPGFLDDLITATIKSLPKTLRVQLIPAPDTARKIREWISIRYPNLPGTAEWSEEVPEFSHVFTQAAIAVAGAQIHPEVFNAQQIARLPGYVRMTFSVERDTKQKPSPAAAPGFVLYSSASASQEETLGASKDLAELQNRFAEAARHSARKHVERKARKAQAQGKNVAKANLLSQAGASSVPRSQMLWDEAVKHLALPAERISSRWLGDEALMLAAAPYDSTRKLVSDLQLAAVKRLLPDIGKVTDDTQLAQAVSGVEDIYEDTVYAVAKDVVRDLQSYGDTSHAVSGTADLPLLSVLQSVREHIASLVFPGFIAQTPPENLARISVYCQADLLRIRKAKDNKSRDVQWAWQADEARSLVDRAHETASSTPAGPGHDKALKTAGRIRWMYEEFLISLWAQELGTLQPVSIQRMQKLLDTLQ